MRDALTAAARRGLIGAARAATLAVTLAVGLFGLIELAPGDPRDLLADPDTGRLPTCVPAALLEGPAWGRLVAAVGGVLPGPEARAWALDGCPRLYELGVDHLGPTLALQGLALLVGLPLGVAVGFGSALAPRVVDAAGRVVAALLMSTPSFAVAALVVVTAPRLGLPTGGLASSLLGPPTAGDVARHLILPVAVLAALLAAPVARLTRQRAIEVLEGDLVRACRVRGLPERRVLLHHALPLSLTPAAQVVGLYLPRLVGGGVVIEQVFGVPGMGMLLVEASRRQDLPVVVAGFSLVVLLVAVGGAVADGLSSWIDPRVGGEARP